MRVFLGEPEKNPFLSRASNEGREAHTKPIGADHFRDRLDDLMQESAAGS